MNKTLWQRIYSWFGFWSYINVTDQGGTYTVWYWVMFPDILGGKFYRKFDLFKIKKGR